MYGMFQMPPVIIAQSQMNGWAEYSMVVRTIRINIWLGGSPSVSLHVVWLSFISSLFNLIYITYNKFEGNIYFIFNCRISCTVVM
jgi:hypothetical protein